MLLAGCATPRPTIKIKLKNQKVCVVAGTLSAGVDCTNTLGGFNTNMSLDELIRFLEGNPESGVPPAVIMSFEDFREMKTDLDIACMLVKDNCSMAVR